VQVWDALGAEDTPKQVLIGHTNKVSSVSLAAFQERLYVASGSDDETVRVWDALASVGTPKRVLPGHVVDDANVSLAAFKKQLYAASCNPNGSVRVWDALGSRDIPGASPRETTGHVSVSLAAFDGRLYAVSFSWDGTVWVWNVLASKRTTKQVWLRRMKWVTSVALAGFKGGIYVAAGGLDFSVCVWDTLYPGLGPEQVLRGLTGSVTSISLAAFEEGLYVVAGIADGTVRVWNALSGQPLGEPLPHARKVAQVQLLALDSGRTPVLLTVDEGHWVRLWHPGAQRPWCQFPLETQPLAFAVHTVKGREELIIAARAHNERGFAILRFAVRNLPGVEKFSRLYSPSV